MNYQHTYRRVKPTRFATPLGEFKSVVTNVAFDDDYFDGAAFRVTYRLTSKMGANTDFSELFYNDERNTRTEGFLAYLDEHGIKYSEDGLPQIVGMEESLVIKKRPTSRGSALPSIESRSFISLPSSEA